VRPPLVVAASRRYETVHGIQCAIGACPATLVLSFVASALGSMPTDHEAMTTALASAATALRWSRSDNSWLCPAHQRSTP